MFTMTLTAFGIAICGANCWTLPSTLLHAERLGYSWCVTTNEANRCQILGISGCIKVGDSSNGWIVMFCRDHEQTARRY
jgi:hypothetical protein